MALGPLVEKELTRCPPKARPSAAPSPSSPASAAPTRPSARPRRSCCAAVGLLLLAHGAQKLFGWFSGHGLVATGEFFAGIGYGPGLFWATAVALLEVFGGIMLALGLLTRPVAAAVVVFMAVAVTQYWPTYFWSEQGFEMPLLWGAAALFSAIRGGGRYSLNAPIGKEV